MKKIKLLIFVLLVFLFLPSGLLAEEATNKNKRLDEMAAFIDRQMSDYITEKKVPNAVVAAVTRDSIWLLKGYGYADRESQIMVDPEQHLFRTGSVSKLFTWTAVLQLYERGLVDIHADINTYLDVALAHEILYETKSPEPITLYHLMTHTAGYEDVLENLFGFEPLPSLKDQLLRKVPARIYPPGEVMAYSNWGTSLAGYVVEQVSGMTYEAYVEENILAPLGMQHTSFEQPLPDELRANMVHAYRWVEGEYLQGNFEHMPAPAGGQSTTAKDMALYLQAHLNGGTNQHGRILQATTLEMMHVPAFRHHPLSSGMTYGMMESVMNGQRVIAHGGSSSVFDAGFFVFPDIEMGIFVAYSGGDYTGSIRVLRSFLDEFFPYTESERTQPESLLAVDLAKLEGEYQQSRSMKTSADRILNLMIGSLHLRTVDDNEFRFSLYDMDFEFEELTPGVYKSKKQNTGYPFGAMEYLFAAMSPDGRLMLVTDGPMTLIKAPWYETTSFAGFIFIPALLFALLSLLFFMGRLIYRKVSHASTTWNRAIVMGNRLMLTHACLLLSVLLLFMINSEPHPVHLLPASFFEHNPVFDTVLTLGFSFVGIMGLVLLLWTISLWIRKPAFVVAKVIQSIYALWAAGLAWLLYFYNMMGW